MQRDLDRLGLDDWRVVAERGEADGDQTCSYFVLDPERRAVVLIPMDGPAASDDPPYRVLARDLGRLLEERCLSLPDAATRTRQLAAEAGIDAGPVVHEVADDGASCARAEVNVGGRVEVIIRGPQG